mgnify:CR=1 FL=1
MFPYDGDGCTDCVFPYTGESCTDCTFPFTGDFCTECQGNFVGVLCDYCKLGYKDPQSNCTHCADHWNDDCSACQYNWDGPTCGYCAEHFQGEDCTECENNWQGEQCDVCPSRFMASPGNCQFCSLRFRGENCTQCAEGYKGEDCSQPISATEQTFDTVAYLVDPFLYQLIVIALGIILTFACIVLILVLIFMRLQKKKYFEHDRPLLDLDEEDAIELETNPMDNVSMLNLR